MELNQTYFEKTRDYKELALTDADEAAKLQADLDAWYFENYERLSEENKNYRANWTAAGTAILLESYLEDENNYASITDNDKKLVDALIDNNIRDYSTLEDIIKGNYENIGAIAENIYGDMDLTEKDVFKDIVDLANNVMANTRKDWTSGAQQIANIWNKDNGSSVRNQITEAYDKIEDANQKYRDAVDKWAEIVERDFNEEGIADAIERAEDEIDELRYKTQDLVNDSVGYLYDIRDIIDQIADAWRSVQNEIEDAIRIIQIIYNI